MLTRVSVLCAYCAGVNGLTANLVEDEVVLDVTTDRSVEVVERVEIVATCACGHSQDIASDHPRLLDAVRDWLEARARRHRQLAVPRPATRLPIGYVLAN